MYAQKSITQKWIDKYKEENAKVIESLKASMNNQKDQLEQNEKLIQDLKEKLHYVTKKYVEPDESELNKLKHKL